MAITFERVKSELESEGFKLIKFPEFTNKEKCTIECPKGHVYEQMYSNFYRGNRCYTCGNLTLEKVKDSLETEGYEVLSMPVVSSRSHVYFKCPKGHEHKIRWNDWKTGQRCGICNRNFKKDITYLTLLAAAYTPHNIFELLDNPASIIRPLKRKVVKPEPSPTT